MRDPKVLLADEPLAHLDAEARRRARIEFLRIQRDASPATLYATNDPAEAMTMADRVAVLNQGAIVQVGRRSRSTADHPMSSSAASSVCCR